ncbi:D-aminoacylase [Xylanimonas oleitrophica]|uniref:D-aminoacylase n=1 Tax=Xylanimonas oleitrophica TaxID=2607479 RepID=A0A2W5WWX6_9MICO|nr:amidohydrolase family protein [Xylanimonas oleitrophica]PZR55143.1 D-aminoacylase [Xylanimonas oleitrophica]
MTDLVVRGALLPQPDRGLSAPHDLHLAGGRVSAVVPSGRPAPPGVRVLDAGGRVAVPGFVDAHVHGAAAVLDPDVQLAMLRQGVTSIVVGQDGVGFAPSDERTCAWAAQYFAGIDGVHPTFRGGSVAELLATYDGTTAVNVATLVPHGTVRLLVMGAAQRPATADETGRMAAIVGQALDDGAVGLSTGLEYVPAAWADEAELVALARVVAERGLPHVSHMRGYEAAAPTAFAELVRIARATGVATHVSHLHGPSDALGAMVEDAGLAGLDVTFDSYPYLRGCSILAMVALPTWLPLADPDATLAALTGPATADRLHAHLATLDDLWPRTTLAWVPGTDPVTGEALRWAEGLTVPQVAEGLGVRPADAALRLLVASRLRASCVFAQPPTNSAESVRVLADHPAQVAGSDAIYAPFGLAAEAGGEVGGGGFPHPRGWGAFARLLAGRVLGRATDLHDGAGADLLGLPGPQEEAVPRWSWADAVEHMSARAARRFRLAGHGSLAPGAAGDVVLVDPQAVQDQATYADPRRPASGIDDVVVAGVPVLARGRLTGATPGRPLRPAPVGVPRAPGRQ